MKGTKLWVEAGSPLIQGRSRRERPFWRDWLLACAGAILMGGGAALAVLVYKDAGVETALRAVALPVVPCAAMGGALGVWGSGLFGSSRRWLAGAITGAVLAFGGTVVFVMYLVSRLSG